MLQVSQQLVQTDGSSTGICFQTQPGDQNTSEGQHYLSQPAGFQIQEITGLSVGMLFFKDVCSFLKAQCLTFGVICWYDMKLKIHVYVFS